MSINKERLQGEEMETKLYIIGNGFDAANKLNTSYEDFKKYLIQKCKENQCEKQKEWYEVQKNGMLSPNDYQNSMLMIKMIDTALKRQYGERAEWKNFEAVLGDLQYEDLWGEQEKSELNGVLVHTTFTRLRDYFKDWITNVEKKQSCEAIQGFQDINELYLTFNYTLTLENIYHIPSQNICHIHGVLGDENLMFGHKYINEKYVGNETAAERQIAIVREMLEKDTALCFMDHRDFFQKVNNRIKEVISIGFSYSEVDMYYIDKIIKSVGINTTWYIHNFKYDIKDIRQLRRLLRKHGFYGRIKFFNDIGCYLK